MGFKDFVLGAFVAAAISVSAQDDKISVAPIGRIFTDAAAYMTGDDDFSAGAAIPEARLGLKASYDIFRAKIEAGVSYGKLALKDVYLQADLSPHFVLRAGNFLHYYGLQSAYSSMQSTLLMPTSNAVFDLPRSIGILGIYQNDRWLAAASISAESKATVLSTADMGKSGWGLTMRIAARLFRSPGNILQIGWSGAFMTPQYNEDEALNHHSFTLQANFPTCVSNVTALSALVPQAESMFKFTPELLMAKGRVALESQYYFAQVFRNHGFCDYRAYGAYGILRGILKGGEYSYHSQEAKLQTPAPGSLELALGYNYTDLSDGKAGIYGGRLNDVSCTFNWYINKYIVWRFRCSYTHTWDRLGYDSIDLGTVQTRLQIIF